MELYDQLAQLIPSPVVELNRAVAVGMAFGPGSALELVDTLTSEPALANYHLLPSVRGDLLKKLGRFEEARSEFERAAELTQNARERKLLRQRARLIDEPGGLGPPLIRRRAFTTPTITALPWGVVRTAFWFERHGRNSAATPSDNGGFTVALPSASGESPAAGGAPPSAGKSQSS